MPNNPSLLDKLNLPNVFCTDYSRVTSRVETFDCMVLIGGDMFPRNIHPERKTLIDSFYLNNKPIYFIGCSFMDLYPNEVMEHHLDYCKKVTNIAVRDNKSFSFLKNSGLTNISSGSDTVFVLKDVFDTYKQQGSQNILGISIRKKHNISDEEHMNYCKGMADIADIFINMQPENNVKFLCFSDGSFKDSIVAEEIIQLMKYKKPSIVVYDGDIERFINEFSECYYIVGKRFHSLILALLLDKEFVPFIYEDKNTNLLSDIDYNGIILTFSSTPEQYKLSVSQLLDSAKHYNTEKLNSLVEKSRSNFLFFENYTCNIDNMNNSLSVQLKWFNLMNVKKDYVILNTSTEDELIRLKEENEHLREYAEELIEAKEYHIQQTINWQEEANRLEKQIMQNNAENPKTP